MPHRTTCMYRKKLCHRQTQKTVLAYQLTSPHVQCADMEFEHVAENHQVIYVPMFVNQLADVWSNRWNEV